MIYNYSVVKGYQMILGDGFVHLSMLIASLVYVTVPIGLGASIDIELSTLYWQ